MFEDQRQHTEPGPDSFRAHFEELRQRYTAWRLKQTEDRGKILTVPQIHDEFEAAINKHILDKGNLHNFDFETRKKKKSVEH